VAVNVAKNRFGAPGRETEIEIRYLADGEHAAALDRFATADYQETAQPQPLTLLQTA
jgi:hypothetical protein